MSEPLVIDTAQPSPVEVLPIDECWQLLRSTTVARLAVDIAKQPDIFPINYTVDHQTIVFRSGAGTKLAGAVLGGYVALEIDGAEPDNRTVWSVVLKGTAREISHIAERFAADDLPLFPWVANPKPNFVRITPTLVTGRRFHVVDSAQLGELAEIEKKTSLDPDAQSFHPGEPQLTADGY